MYFLEQSIGEYFVETEPASGKCPEFVAVIDAEGNIVSDNPGLRRLFGEPAGSSSPKWHIRDCHPQEEARHLLEEALPAARETGCWQGETKLQDSDGHVFPVYEIVHAQYNEHGELGYFSITAHDMRPYQEVRRKLWQMLSALDQSGDMVWITDIKGIVQYVNRAVERTTGYTAKEICGRKAGALWKSGVHDQAFYKRLWSQIKAGQPFSEVFTNRNREGQLIYMEELVSPVQDAEETITHFIATARDITQRLALEERLRQLAYYDPLTGLANRSHFEEHLGRSQARVERTGEAIALLMIDLDRFKGINDTLGHTAGDELLAQVAQRLNGSLRASDLIARWGGDEFVILLDPVDGKKGAREVAEKLGKAMGPSFTIQDTTLYINISIGISLLPENASDKAGLLKQADIAMYEAKRAKGSSFRFYSSQNLEASNRRFEDERNLEQALVNDTCEPFFQAIIHLSTGAVVGAEALVRCRLSEREEWITPDRLIPAAERTGLIHQLGAQILRKACRQFQQWRNAGHGLERLTVNVSPSQLAEENFIRLVGEILEEEGFNPGWLELEITEEVAFSDESKAISALEELSRLGIAIALDDFGTGYSSLSSIHMLPLSDIKIDRSFIQNVDQVEKNQAIVKSIVGLGESFNCGIIAEGVERSEEAEYLNTLGIEKAQGFLFGRPVRAQEFENIHLRTL